jgi:outer membrane murein-binding lipoprotein Lpp
LDYTFIESSAKIDQLAGSKLSRSVLIELVLRSCISETEQEAMHARDLNRINAAADRLNAEVNEVLAYQHAPKDKSI